MNNFLQTVALTALLLFTGDWAEAATAGQQPRVPYTGPAQPRADSEIRIAVLRGLVVNPEVLAAGVRVSVQAGVVTLTGAVHSAKAKKMAAGVAASVPGVRKVIDHLEVHPVQIRD